MSSKITARNITVEYPLRSLQLFKKVNCTIVQSLRLCTGRTAYRGNRGIALYTPGKNPVLIVQEAGWAPGPVRTGAENVAPTRIRFPDGPARSQSLYQLR
jgi:hypothetical protein